MANLVWRSASKRGCDVFTAPSVSVGAGIGSGGCVSACWGLCGDSVMTFPVSNWFPNSQGSEGSCNGDRSGCMGRKEIEPYALCDGTSPSELRCNSGLVSRVMGLSRLLRGEE